MVQASPNVGNYMVGKGVMKIKLAGEANFRDLGNAPVFELTPNIGKLAHFSSRQGRKFKDANVTQQIELTMKITLDEITPDNLALALMGSETDSTGLVHNILDLGEITAAIRFIGTNDVGDKQQVDLPTVSITPSGAIGFITDGWTQLELTGDVTADQNGSFGTNYHDIDGEINP